MEREAPVYTDYRQKHITVPGLRPGEVLEYDMVTVIHTPLAAGQFWADYDFDKTNIDLDEELDVDVPADRRLKLKSKPGMDPKITEENGRRVYHWTSSHLEREDDAKRTKIKPRRKRNPDDDRPDVQLTTFVSWEQIGRWYASLEKDRRAPTPEVRAKAEEFTKGLTSDLAKSESTLRLRGQEFSLREPLARLGPLPAQLQPTFSTTSMAIARTSTRCWPRCSRPKACMPSSVLINSSRKLDPDVPSPSQFDHVITMLPDGAKREVWMDTTSEVAPFRLLAYSLRNKQALVIPRPVAMLLPTSGGDPADTPMPDTEVSEITGKINEIGKLEAHVQYAFRGDEELLLRSVFRRVPQANWQRVAENINSGLGGDVSHLIVSDPAATKEPFTLSYDISKPNFLDWSKKKRIYSAAGSVQPA